MSSNDGLVIKVHRRLDPFFWQKFSLFPYLSNRSPEGKSSYSPHPELPVVLDMRLEKVSLPDRVLIGSGIDPYHPLERRWRITRRTLEVLAKHNHPLLLITRYDLLLRDVDLLRELNEQSQVVVSVPLCSLSLKMAEQLKVASPPPQARVALLERVCRSGLPTGIILTPLEKNFNDTERYLAPLFRLAADIGLDFVSLPDYPSRLTHKSRRVLRELVEAFGLPLRVPRFIPRDYRRENYWLAGQLGERAILHCLEGKHFRPLHRAACRFNQLAVDVRNLWRSRDKETLREMSGEAWPVVEELLDGRWAEQPHRPVMGRS